MVAVQNLKFARRREREGAIARSNWGAKFPSFLRYLSAMSRLGSLPDAWQQLRAACIKSAAPPVDGAWRMRAAFEAAKVDATWSIDRPLWASRQGAGDLKKQTHRSAQMLVRSGDALLSTSEAFLDTANRHFYDRARRLEVVRKFFSAIGLGHTRVPAGWGGESPPVA
jgi:hypothetical protein